MTLDWCSTDWQEENSTRGQETKSNASSQSTRTPGLPTSAQSRRGAGSCRGLGVWSRNRLLQCVWRGEIQLWRVCVQKAAAVSETWVYFLSYGSLGHLYKNADVTVLKLMFVCTESCWCMRDVCPILLYLQNFRSSTPQTELTSAQRWQESQGLLLCSQDLLKLFPFHCLTLWPSNMRRGSPISDEPPSKVMWWDPGRRYGSRKDVPNCIISYRLPQILLKLQGACGSPSVNSFCVDPRIQGLCAIRRAAAFPRHKRGDACQGAQTGGKEWRGMLDILWNCFNQCRSVRNNFVSWHEYADMIIQVKALWRVFVFPARHPAHPSLFWKPTFIVNDVIVNDVCSSRGVRTWLKAFCQTDGVHELRSWRWFA